MTKFTQDEISLVTNVFAQSKVNPTAENAAEVCSLVQSVLKKMNDNKETQDESASPENGTAESTDQHVEPDGDRKAKAAG